MAFDWLSLDVVRYCWPGIDSCGDAGGWISGIATLIASYAAFRIPAKQRRQQLLDEQEKAAQRQRSAAVLLFNEVETGGLRAAASLTAEDELDESSYFGEVAELQAMRLLFMELPSEVVTKLNLFLAFLQQYNAEVDAKVRQEESSGASADRWMRQGARIPYPFATRPSYEDLRPRLKVICQMSIELMTNLVAVADPALNGETDSIGRVQQLLQFAEINFQKPAEAPDESGA